MRRFNLLAISGAAIALACAAPAAPVFAQAVNPDANAVDSNAVVGDHGNWTLKEREDWLGDRLRVARDDGSIDDSEFDRVRHELDHIRDSENQLRGYHDGQLTDNETASLETRLDGVADQIHWLHEDQFRKPW